MRPHLEYGQCVWSPHLEKHLNLLENVQIRATKLVDNLGKLEYEERLKRLDLPTLRYRRFRGDMIELYKHFNKYDKDILSASFKPKQRATRTHAYQLLHQKAKDGIRGVQRNSFYHRTTKLWNDLPENVVNASDINTFKNELDAAMENKKFDRFLHFER